MNDSKIIRNWKYYDYNSTIEELYITEGQFMTGNIAGILIAPEMPAYSFNSICNAKTFQFPVRYKIINFENKNSIEHQIKNAISELEHEGCRFILTSGGEFGKYDNIIKKSSSLLSLSSPLQALQFLDISVSKDKYFIIISSQKNTHVKQLLRSFGFVPEIINRCKIINYRESFSYDSESFSFIDESIGGIIWDSINSDFIIRQYSGLPIYSMVTIARFLKNVCAQSPYNGII